MQVKQFEDKNLSHYSYAIISDCAQKMVVIDPTRSVQQYLDFARQHEVEITGIIETHPHADFISGHLELHEKTGAIIYTSPRTKATYPHHPFHEGEFIELGKIRLSAIDTPGHSPDSISVILYHDDKQKAVFTGDTLFVGDCGRPDLRDKDEDASSKKNELAKQMYHSLRDKLMPLNNDVTVYPTHGAGSLCGKNLSKESSSTIGKEKETNWSLQSSTEQEFINNLLADQPFVPAYFSFDVAENRAGATPLHQSLAHVKISSSHSFANSNNHWIIDVRNQQEFKAGHLPYSINLGEDGKFETWLGSIIQPNEPFILAGNDEQQLKRMMERAAAIGYEQQLLQAITIDSGTIEEDVLDVNKFGSNPGAYTIVDVRNKNEREEETIFEHSLSIPLAEVRERVNEIPTDKPIVVHCSGGYRSAAGSSIIHELLKSKVKVFDLGQAVEQFQHNSD